MSSISSIDNSTYRRYLLETPTSMSQQLLPPLVRLVIAYCDYSTVVILGGITPDDTRRPHVDIYGVYDLDQPVETYAITPHDNRWSNYLYWPSPQQWKGSYNDMAHVTKDAIFYVTCNDRYQASIYYCDMKAIKPSQQPRYPGGPEWKQLKSFLSSATNVTKGMATRGEDLMNHRLSVTSTVLHDRLYVLSEHQLQVWNHHRYLWTALSPPPSNPLMVALSVTPATSYDPLMTDDASHLVAPILRSGTTKSASSDSLSPTSYLYAILAPIPRTKVGAAEEAMMIQPFVRYDPVADTWTSLASMPFIRYRARAVLVPQVGIIIIGGCTQPMISTPGDGSGSSSNDDSTSIPSLPLLKYSFKHSSWSITSWYMPERRYLYDFSVIYANGQLLLTGGGNGSQFTSSCWTLDVHDDLSVWKKHPPLPFKRYGHTCIAIA
jgi:hypothetical protein